jgi:PAS domain S-box-containing protein
MNLSTLSPREIARLRVLHRHDVIGAPREQAFDDLVRLAALILRMPIALISLVDRDKQWFLARYGTALEGAPRGGSPCALVVEEGRTLLVPDALDEPRFASAPLVELLGIRSYAGIPLTTREGFVLGSLCVLDLVPRTLEPEALEQLHLIAGQAVALLDQRRRLRSVAIERALAEEAGNLFVVVDLAGRVQDHGEGLPSLVAEPQLIGRSLAELLPREGTRVQEELARLLDTGERSADFFTASTGEGVPVRAWHLSLDPATELVHVLAVDVSPQVHARTRAETASEMLRVIGEVQRRWITGTRTQELFDELLGQLLHLSGSSFGFLAELQVEGDVEARVVVRNRALAGIASSPSIRRFYDKLDDLDEDHVFVRVLDSRAPVLVNELSAHEREHLELPDEHPHIRCFLGLPFLEGRRLIGMVGLANAEGGYDADTIAHLEPFLSTGANLLAAQRLAQRRRASERALAESEARLRAIVDTAVDAIVTVDASARIERANPAVTRLFGYQPSELIGTPFTHLVGRLPLDPSVLEAPRAAGRLPGQLETWVLGVSEEILGIRSDGSCFPLEIAISQMWLGERRMFTAIIRDATERRRIDALRSEFVSTVSHELRTPLTSIRGSLGLLAGGVAGELPSRAVQMVGIALSNCERLSRLIDDLLDIEKIESGRLEFATVPLGLPDLLGETVEANAGFALAHATSFELDIPSELGGARVLADPGRLAQVVANLLSNAAKFSANAPVAVSLRRHLGQLRVEVNDAGPGVPEAMRERIFQRFTQAEDELSRKRRGTGLGLSIAKAIIERLGGQIGYHPRSEGGSCFWFELPEFRDPLE